jgi:hypothetical protein
VPHDDVVAFGRSLAALLASPDARRRLGVAARRHVERRFGVSTLVAEHVSLYTQVLGEPAAAPMAKTLR